MLKVMGVIIMVILITLTWEWRGGSESIHYVQAYFPHTSFYHDLFNYSSMLLDPLTVLVGTVLGLILDTNKIRTIERTFFVLINGCMLGMLKSGIGHPRPFWHLEIQHLGPYCPPEFANPSGHSWFSIVGVYLLLDCFEWRRSAVAALSPFLVVIPLSRLYLGVHTLQQVCFGMSMGFLFCYLHRKGALLSLRSSHTLNRLTIFTYICVMFGLFYFNEYHWEIPKEWFENFKIKCLGQGLNLAKINYVLLALNVMEACVLYGFVEGFDAAKKDTHSPKTPTTFSQVAVLFGNLGLFGAISYFFNQGPIQLGLLLLGALSTGYGFSLMTLRPFVGPRSQ